LQLTLTFLSKNAFEFIETIATLEHHGTSAIMKELAKWLGQQIMFVLVGIKFLNVDCCTEKVLMT